MRTITGVNAESGKLCIMRRIFDETHTDIPLDMHWVVRSYLVISLQLLPYNVVTSVFLAPFSGV